MKRNTKPAILKTFSEFTIEELRAMPLRRVLTLFREEVTKTLTERKPVSNKPKKKVKTSKKQQVATKPLTEQLVSTMKRLFSIHKQANSNVLVQEETKEKGKRQKKKSEVVSEAKAETVVFSSQRDSDEPPMTPMLSTQ